MSDKLYDILNKIQRWLPAFGIFYLALCEIWHLPLGNEINKTIVALAALLATTLEIANGKYQESKKVELEEIEFKKYEG